MDRTEVSFPRPHSAFENTGCMSRTPARTVSYCTAKQMFLLFVVANCKTAHHFSQLGNMVPFARNGPQKPFVLFGHLGCGQVVVAVDAQVIGPGGRLGLHRLVMEVQSPVLFGMGAEKQAGQAKAGQFADHTIA